MIRAPPRAITAAPIPPAPASRHRARGVVVPLSSFFREIVNSPDTGVRLFITSMAGRTYLLCPTCRAYVLDRTTGPTPRRARSTWAVPCGARGGRTGTACRAGGEWRKRWGRRSARSHRRPRSIADAGVRAWACAGGTASQRVCAAAAQMVDGGVEQRPRCAGGATRIRNVDVCNQFGPGSAAKGETSLESPWLFF
ncbi:hypothetical protein B0H14DRAFT_1240018 [Mycena olivaceomarginata]|nr:hypothetical protein B0H14DRAFT_1240018 [Mycena olivaceomarginata]